MSLVFAGANPGAFIDNVIMHGEFTEDEALIYSGVNDEFEFMHSDDDSDSEKTLAEVIDGMTKEQKTAMYALMGLYSKALSHGDDPDEEEEGEDEYMKHNIFDTDTDNADNVLSHAEEMEIVEDMKRYGSLKESCLQHGITGIEMLFPEAKTLNNPPAWIKRDTAWADKVFNGAKHTPFSRIKSIFANLTEEEARAKGYIKGHQKKEQVFPVLKRTTDPTTVYKKQKFDRDDLIDITDFSVTSWINSEMGFMLTEELARAMLISDGREAGNEDKIDESHIRPISKEDDLYAVKKVVSVGKDDDEKAKNFIRTAIKTRKEYKGTGTPTLFTTEDMLANMLLLQDGIGHDLYADENQLAKKLRVKEIVTVPVMEGAKGKNGGNLMGIIVNMNDYTVGADKGGQITSFEHFDIDYNQQKYLKETRCSGALTVPYSALVFEEGTGE